MLKFSEKVKKIFYQNKKTNVILFSLLIIAQSNPDFITFFFLILLLTCLYICITHAIHTKGREVIGWDLQGLK